MKKILLLDDNLDTLEMAEHVLAYEKYEIKSVSKSAGFIEIAEKFRPDLLIIDYVLDDGNGGEICQSVKSHETLHNTPVILFTAHIESRLELLDYGCDAVIAKPFDLVNFLTVVRKLTEA